MILRTSLRAALVPLLLSACAPSWDSADGDVAEETGSAIVSGTLREGETLQTTARLNFRTGPSTSQTIQRVLPIGTALVVKSATPQNGFYEVTQGDDEGWVYGRYLKARPAGATDDKTPSVDSPDPNPGTDPGANATVASSGSCDISYYAEGSRTANGERFNPDGLTAAHKTLPFDTKIRVTNLENGKSVIARVNDRGPFVAGRCIDLSRGAFVAIASLSEGVLRKSNVKYEVLE